MAVEINWLLSVLHLAGGLLFIIFYMEPGSRAADSPQSSRSTISTVIGTLIALLTLALPIFATTYFSTSSLSALGVEQAGK